MRTLEGYEDDGEPVLLLLDKDGTFPKIQIAEDYWYIKRPTVSIFADCCNEFHWCLNNVAKGIARSDREILCLSCGAGLPFDFD